VNEMCFVKKVANRKSSKRVRFTLFESRVILLARRALDILF
jgi:hypothetical protein